MKTCKYCEKSFSNDEFIGQGKLCKICRYNRYERKICKTCGNTVTKNAECRICKYKNGKYCNCCKKTLDISEFKVRSTKLWKLKGGKEEYSYNIYRSNCQKCEREISLKSSRKPENKNRARKSEKIWKLKNKDRVIKYNIMHKLKKWNIPGDQIDSLTEKIFNQKTCECCGCEFTTNNKKHMDHCHEKNIFRGVICRCCNHTIGHSKEKTKRLKDCVKYLERN